MVTEAPAAKGPSTLPHVLATPSTYYISNRTDQLDYQGAIEKGLPIGSGEIESAHRYVIQKRLKLPGAWWKAANVEPMLALCVVRANDDWEKYWQNLTTAVAV